MENIKISFVATVYNEEHTIEELLSSIASQSILPDEVIIVDGMSTDATTSIISNFNFLSSNKKVKLIIKPGNRAVGRNEGIKQAKGNIIVVSDAGCILDNKWVEEITRPFNNKKIDVVAGYYKGKASNGFQEAIIPYVLVMEDKIDPNNFLPASRSMAFRKITWQKIGGFPEKYSYNEDYVFAKRLQKQKATIVFTRDAIVYWIPRSSIKQTYTMFYRFAYGDAEAGIIRPKVLSIFARYLVLLFVIFLFFLTFNYMYLFIIIVGFFLYTFWTIQKNYHYIKALQALYLLPLLQYISDIAVLAGTVLGGVTYGIHKNRT